MKIIIIVNIIKALFIGEAETVCEVTEQGPDGEILATDCYPEAANACAHGTMCCDVYTLGCFCSDNEVRCPPGSVKAPCPPGTSC